MLSEEIAHHDTYYYFYYVCRSIDRCKWFINSLTLVKKSKMIGYHLRFVMQSICTLQIHGLETMF